MKRPRVKIPLTRIDYVVEVLSVLVILSTVICFIFYWVQAPEIVPVHYNIAGEPDNFGTKNTSLLLPFISILLYIGMTVINKYPYIFNFPVKVTSENAFSLYSLATRLIRFIKLLVCLLILCVVWHQANVVLNPQPENIQKLLFPFLMNILTIVIIASPVYFVVRIIKK